MTYEVIHALHGQQRISIGHPVLESGLQVFNVPTIQGTKNPNCVPAKARHRNPQNISMGRLMGRVALGFQLRSVWNSAKQLQLWESTIKIYPRNSLLKGPGLQQLPPIGPKKVWSRCSVASLKPLPNPWSSCSLLSWGWKNPTRLFPSQNSLSLDSSSCPFWSVGISLMNRKGII